MHEEQGRVRANKSLQNQQAKPPTTVQTHPHVCFARERAKKDDGEERRKMLVITTPTLHYIMCREKLREGLTLVRHEGSVFTIFWS